MLDRLDSLLFTAPFSSMYRSRSKVTESSMKRDTDVNNSGSMFNRLDSLLFTAIFFYSVSFVK